MRGGAAHEAKSDQPPFDTHLRTRTATPVLVILAHARVTFVEPADVAQLAATLNVPSERYLRAPVEPARHVAMNRRPREPRRTRQGKHLGRPARFGAAQAEAARTLLEKDRRGRRQPGL